MKNHNIILGTSFAALLFAFAPGCARDTAQPTSTPAPTALIDARAAVLVQGDLAPKQLFKLPMKADLGTEVQTVSLPTSPRHAFALPARPERAIFKQTLVVVPPGASAGEKLVAIDTPDGASVYVGSKTSDPAAIDGVTKDVQFVAPDLKTRVDVRVEKAAQGLKKTADKPMTAFTLDNKAVKGEFVFRYGSAAAKSGVSVEVQMPNSPIAMEITPSTGQMLLGENANVSVKLTNAGRAVVGAKLECELVRPDGSKGAAVPWREVGDGVYEALVSNVLGLSDAIGAYNINVRATGASEGLKFDRFGYTAMGFAIPTARIDAAGLPRTVGEANAITGFEADVNVEAASGDRYEVSATLVATSADGTERPVAETQTTMTLGEGKHKVTLRFDAGHIALTKLDGTYSLRNLRLYSLGTNALYHRLGRGLDVKFPAVRVADLMPLREVTPAIEQMMQDGEFDLNVKP